MLPHQAQAWTSKKRIIALVGGTGAGKTWYAPRWVYRALSDNPGWRCLALGTGYERHVTNVMMFEMSRYLNAIGLKGKYELNRKGGLLTLPNESQIIFGSAENPLNMEGPHLELCWIDEAGMMQRMAWDVAQRRTGHFGGQILITTVPYFWGWLKSDVYEKWLAGEPSIDWIPCKTGDNPTYNLDEIERMRRTLRPEKFAIYYDGLWAKPVGLIYPEPDDDQLIVEPFEIPDDWPQYSGVDWGFTAPTAAVWARLDVKTDTLYIVGEYERREETVDEHVVRWTRMGVLDNDEVFGDPAAPEMNQRASDLGYPISKATNAVDAGVDAVYSRMKSGRLKVFRGCKTWLDHRATYVWATNPRNEEELLDKPQKPQPAEHMMDATRYLCMGLAEYGVQEPVETVMSVRRRNLLAV